MKVLLTGATGFIGKKLIDLLSSNNDIEITVSTRRDDYKNNKVKNIIVQEINSISEWDYLENIDIVIHLAATQHIIKTKTNINTFKELNIDGTKRLIDYSIKNKIKKFIYLSTVQVHGDFTNRFESINENSPYNPQSDYARSKIAAEEYIIRKFLNFCETKFIIIRSPLIYGKGVKGNLKSLKKLLRLNIPIPLDGVNNSRSLISLSNITNFIYKCVYYNHIENEVFLISDNNNMSTSKLIRKMVKYSKSPLIMFYLPKILLKSFFILVNKKIYIKKLLLDYKIDISKVLKMTDWHPKKDTDNDIAEMMRDD